MPDTTEVVCVPQIVSGTMEIPKKREGEICHGPLCKVIEDIPSRLNGSLQRTPSCRELQS